jgi:hypothetical protein
MTLSSLQALTWCTVAGAVASALLLASGDSGLPDGPRQRHHDAAPRTALPADRATVAVERKGLVTAPAGMISPVSKRDLGGR